MTKITSFDLTPFYRNTVGIDSLFDRITRNIDMAANAGNYPPYDIVKTGDESYEIRIAAAGFRQDIVLPKLSGYNNFKSRSWILR